MNDALKFSADFLLKDKELVLTYQVINMSSRDIYVLNRLFLQTPVWKMDPDVIYIHLDWKTETIWLNKKLSDIPMGINITAPVAPFVTPVRAGETFREEVNIPVPVKDYRQYGSHQEGPSIEDTEPVQRTYKFIYFTLGYYWATKGTTETSRDIHGTEVIIPVVPLQEQPLQFGEFVSSRTRLNVPVIEYHKPNK